MNISPANTPVWTALCRDAVPCWFSPHPGCLIGLPGHFCPMSLRLTAFISQSRSNACFQRLFWPILFTSIAPCPSTARLLPDGYLMSASRADAGGPLLANAARGSPPGLRAQWTSRTNDSQTFAVQNAAASGGRVCTIIAWCWGMGQTVAFLLQISPNFPRGLNHSHEHCGNL